MTLANQPEPTRTNHEIKSDTNANHFESATFKYRGRKFRLFKRTDGPEANWYFRFERAGQRHGPWSLGTSARALAEAEAKLKIDLFEAGRLTDLRRSMERPGVNGGPTLGELFTLVPKLAIRADAKSRGSYVWAMRWVLSRALKIEPAAVDKLPLSQVNGENARRFFVVILLEAGQLAEQHAQNKLKRNAFQIFGFAKALVAPAAVDSLAKDHGMKLPNFDAFRLGSKSGASLLKPGEASEFESPANAVLRQLLVQWMRIGRTPGYVIPAATGSTKGNLLGKPLPDWLRKNIFIAIGLELSCGLRKSEVSKAQWNWFQTEHGAPRLVSYRVNVKNASGQISVRPVDPFWHILNSVVDRNGWRGAAADHCLAERPKVAGDHRALQFSHGGHCDRTYWPFYYIGQLLRGLGFQTQKTNHALRDLTASRITMKYGLERASRWCRHGQLATTEAHYSRFVNDDEMDNPKLLAWFRWAK